MKNMNRPITSKQRVAAGAGFSVAVAAATALFALPVSADNDAKAAAAKAPSLSGSELYAIHCNRCHSERYPKEFQASQWKTLLTHMRVRANLPASHAKEILKYLQEESGN